MIKTVVKKKVTHRNRKFGMIYPEDDWKSFWDLYITVILVYTCVATPMILALYDAEDPGWARSNDFIDLCFLLDVYFTFNSAYYDADFILT